VARSPTKRQGRPRAAAPATNAGARRLDGAAARVRNGAATLAVDKGGAMPIRSLRSIAASQRPVTFGADVPVVHVARTMRERQVSAAMVVSGTRLVGIFTERDALFRVLAEGRDPQTTSVGDVMTRDPQTIDPARPFVDALRMMHDGHFRHVPIVEDGRPIGMVSARDALHADFTELVEILATHETLRD
jgi:CBS domain-containing protein